MCHLSQYWFRRKEYPMSVMSPGEPFLYNGMHSFYSWRAWKLCFVNLLLAKDLACCVNKSTSTPKHEILFVSMHGQKSSYLSICPNCKFSSSLMKLGFFGCSPRPFQIRQGTKYRAFHIPLLEHALRLVNSGSPYQRVAESLFGADYFELNSKNVHGTIYRQFCEALRQFTYVDWMYRHCRIIESISLEFDIGKTDCPCCGVKHSRKGPFIMVILSFAYYVFNM